MWQGNDVHYCLLEKEDIYVFDNFLFKPNAKWVTFYMTRRGHVYYPPPNMRFCPSAPSNTVDTFSGIFFFFFCTSVALETAACIIIWTEWFSTLLHIVSFGIRSSPVWFETFTTAFRKRVRSVSVTDSTQPEYLSEHRPTDRRDGQKDSRVRFSFTVQRFSTRFFLFIFLPDS